MKVLEYIWRNIKVRYIMLLLFFAYPIAYLREGRRYDGEWHGCGLCSVLDWWENNTFLISNGAKRTFLDKIDSCTDVHYERNKAQDDYKWAMDKFWVRWWWVIKHLIIG